MAANLCCTAEQDSRANSPELPNVRVSEATPAKRPLLQKEATSPNSRFTSAQTDELHELQQIFNRVHDDASNHTPQRAQRLQSSRPSIISLQSLHKMTSVRSIIRRKFSKDMSRNSADSPATKNKAKHRAAGKENETIIKHERQDAKDKIRITKDDIRRDLLSDKKPDQGGYDSDAELLDEVAKNIGKKSPGTRPSIHSIDWTSSIGSKATPGSSSQGRNSAELKRDVQPYQISKPQTISFKSRIAQVFSTPNLRVEEVDVDNRKLRRSHSAKSMRLPRPSPISPLRLPSLKSQDQDGTPWAEVMHESLRLPHFPSPPRHVCLQPSKTMSDIKQHNDITNEFNHEKKSDNSSNSYTAQEGTYASPSARTIEIRVQQPTSTATPRPSTSFRGTFCDVAEPVKDEDAECSDVEDDENNPRRSVHLYSMRISHHLRSGSLLSWDQLADAIDLPTPPHPFRQRTVSDQSRSTHHQAQSLRHERQKSSSGFASSKVPSKWGKVVPKDRDSRADAASSIYSSRPQSPPDSFGGSMAHLPQADTSYRTFSYSSIDLRHPRRSHSFPTDMDDTPRPPKRYGVLEENIQRATSAGTSVPAAPILLARKNSVAITRKSKFHEEFSPSPTKKKLTPSTSIMKLLPKRLSMRSQSEANLKVGGPDSTMDGQFDTLPVTTDKERRKSVSMMSLQVEQAAMAKSKDSHHVWDRALKAHHEEKASMFLPHNKDFATYACPFRERSGSVSARRLSSQSEVDPLAQSPNLKRFSAPLLEIQTPPAIYVSGRTRSLSHGSVKAGRKPENTSQNVTDVFEEQGDSPKVVGAWGRYPSHTRNKRVSSAGKEDLVETRDFALEAAIHFATAQENDMDVSKMSPVDHTASPIFLSGERKRKKKIASGKIAKSHSMTFGRKLIKEYYAGIFKSSSSEFRKHGRGHRSSIASGGHLAQPELELLPDIFRPGGNDGGNDKKDGSSKNRDIQAQAKMPNDNSMATLHIRRNSSAPNLNEMNSLRCFHDGAGDSEHGQDRARVWSMYYEHCVPAFPRLSSELHFGYDDVGRSPRLSLDSRHSNIHSRIVPVRTSKHSRNVSQLSRMSTMSRGSARPSFMSMGEDDGGGDHKSLVSVRRSTMDLISKFKQQEVTEHERVLSLTRAESRRGALSE